MPDITSLMQVGDDYVREVIHAFNERGFEARQFTHPKLDQLSGQSCVTGH